MAQYNFGVGSLSLIPGGASATPVQVGTLKDVSFDISLSMKSLIGNQQYPVALGRGAGKISGKAKSAQLNGALISQLLPGSSLATGSTTAAIGESAVVPASTPYTVTVVNSAKFGADLGVIDLTTGLALACVATGPTTGQYSVAAGVYTFAAADTGHQLAISYSYTQTTGKTVAYTNQLMGVGTTFQMAMFNQFNGKSFGLKLFAVSSSKLSLALKNEDFTEQDIDFEAAADSLNRVAEFYLAE
jgi:hypothetical protein